jgi:HAD superfamily phosphatase (TIGR01668 family)
MKATCDIPLGELDTTSITDSIIILDIDGTLTDTRQSYIAPAIRATIEKLKEHNEVYIFSNNVDGERNLAVATDLDTPYLPSDCRKPFPGVIKALSNPHHKEVIIIGDRWLTDGWFAHNIGASFIKVTRLCTREDGIIFWIVYIADDVLDFFIKRINRFT